MKNRFLLPVLFILLACGKESSEPLPLSLPSTENGILTPYITDEIDYPKALKIAQQAPTRFGGEFTKSVHKTVLTGEPIITNGFTTKSGNASIDTLMYVFNYAEGGYAVVPTLEVESDLIAYVETGEFTIQDTLTDDLSRFLVSMMMDYQKSVVAQYEKERIATKASLRPYGAIDGPKCQDVLRGGGLNYNFGEPTRTPEEVGRKGDDYYKTSGCYLEMRYTDYTEQYLGPLLTTTWGQGDPYNAQTPKIGVSQTKTGCVATAVTQIMVYHAHPTTFPSSMLSLPLTAEFQGYVGKNTSLKSLRGYKTIKPDSYPPPRINASRFIAMIGYMLKNDWGVGSTGAKDKEVPKVFNNMGYGVGPLIPYNGTKTEASLNCSQPVYITGWRTLTKGHAWVADGYKIERSTREQYIYFFDEYGNYHNRRLLHPGSSNNRTIYFHHNFGWDGICNGYYLDGIFDTSRVYESTGSTSSDVLVYKKVEIIPTIVKI